MEKEIKEMEDMRKKDGEQAKVEEERTSKMN